MVIRSLQPTPITYSLKPRPALGALTLPALPAGLTWPLVIVIAVVGLMIVGRVFHKETKSARRRRLMLARLRYEGEKLR